MDSGHSFRRSTIVIADASLTFMIKYPHICIKISFIFFKNWPRDDVINFFELAMPCWNKALWLAVPSHVTTFDQSGCNMNGNHLKPSLNQSTAFLKANLIFFITYIGFVTKLLQRLGTKQMVTLWSIRTMGFLGMIYHALKASPTTISSRTISAMIIEITTETTN